MAMNFGKIAKTSLLASSVVLFAACGQENNNNDSDGEITTIQFYTWGGEGDLPIYEPRIKAFEEANPDIKVDFVQVPSDYDTKLQTMYAGNEAPDVVQVAENGQNFASKGLFIDLSEYIAESSIDVESNWGRQ